MDKVLIKKNAEELRRMVLQIGYESGEKIHYGGCLSASDIIAVLFSGVMKHDKLNKEDPLRDRFYMSKGHSVLSYYVALYLIGYISLEELKTYELDGSDLCAHPVKNNKIGIEASNGSLGHGLGLAVGSLLAGRYNNHFYRSFVLMGDGECDEGSVWEAVMSAAHYKLGNLVAVVDHNKIQSDGFNCEVMNVESLYDKFKAFGWNVFEVNGHNIEQLCDVFSKIDYKAEKPTAIIANTIKGYSVPFMENEVSWHHAKLSKEQYESIVGL